TYAMPAGLNLFYSANTDIDILLEIPVHVPEPHMEGSGRVPLPASKDRCNRLPSPELVLAAGHLHSGTRQYNRQPKWHERPPTALNTNSHDLNPPSYLHLCEALEHVGISRGPRAGPRALRRRSMLDRLLVRCAESSFRLPLGDLLFELFLREERHSGPKEEHVIDRAVPPAFPVSRIDHSGILYCIVVPAGIVDDRTGRQQWCRVVCVRVDFHPVVIVPSAVQHLPAHVGVDRFHAHAPPPTVHVRLEGRHQGVLRQPVELLE